MSTNALFQPIAELIERSLSIRHVYGEPIRQGDTMVIPVAEVAYGFGAGGGRARVGARIDAAAETAGDERTRPEAIGSGGGGGFRMTPLGVLEMGPRGTRFIRYRPLAPLLGAAALGLAVGWLLARRRI